MILRAKFESGPGTLRNMTLRQVTRTLLDIQFCRQRIWKKQRHSSRGILILDGLRVVKLKFTNLCRCQDNYLNLRSFLYSCQFSGLLSTSEQITFPETVPIMSGVSALTIHASAFSTGIGWGAANPNCPAGLKPWLG